MANRTFLLVTDAPYETAGADQMPESAVVCAASNMIPLGWMSLFSPSDIKPRKTQMDDGSEAVYDVLSCRKDAAIQRTRQNWALISPVIGGGSDVYEQFIAFVEKLPGSFIAVETMELWTMFEEDAFRGFLEGCLRAFEVSPCPPGNKINRVTGQQVPSDEWDELLGQANVGGNRNDPIESCSVAGYKWSQPVPWQ